MMNDHSQDPYELPSTTLRNRLGRLAWHVVYILLFRPTPRPLHKWRCLLLKCFGSKLSNSCHIYPRAVIWAPWNLECEDHATIADDAIIYNPAPVYLGSHSIVSQQAYLCGASHDYDDPDFPMVSRPIRLEAYSWVCARANVQMGVTIGEGAVLGLGSLAISDLEPWTVYGGVPAQPLKQRHHQKLHEINAED
jgi:putative colanic acid biosynthesis acetyltransferase WcaF